MDTSSRSGLTGLTTKSTAPARMAAMAASMLPPAVCTMVGYFRGNGPHGRKHRHAAGSPHNEVEQDEGDVAQGVRFQRGNRLVAAFGLRNGIAEALDGLFENTALSRVVADDQDTFGHDAKLTTLRWNPSEQIPSLAPLLCVVAMRSRSKIVRRNGKQALYSSSILVRLALGRLANSP